MRRRYVTAIAFAYAAVLLASATALAADKKPNILVLRGDDIGIYNISAYNLGAMG